MKRFIFLSLFLLISFPALADETDMNKIVSCEPVKLPSTNEKNKITLEIIGKKNNDCIFKMLPENEDKTVSCFYNAAEMQDVHDFWFVMGTQSKPDFSFITKFVDNNFMLNSVNVCKESSDFESFYAEASKKQILSKPVTMTDEWKQGLRQAYLDCKPYNNKVLVDAMFMKTDQDVEIYGQHDGKCYFYNIINGIRTKCLLPMDKMPVYVKYQDVFMAGNVRITVSDSGSQLYDKDGNIVEDVTQQGYCFSAPEKVDSHLLLKKATDIKEFMQKAADCLPTAYLDKNLAMEIGARDADGRCAMRIGTPGSGVLLWFNCRLDDKEFKELLALDPTAEGKYWATVEEDVRMSVSNPILARALELQQSGACRAYPFP